MATRYGHLMDNWHTARKQMRDILIDCARQQRTITYGELCAALTVIELHPNSYAMSGMLREISELDESEGRPILATLVVRKSDGRPGPGYFKSLIEKGLTHEALETYWQEQFKLVCASWAESE